MQVIFSSTFKTHVYQHFQSTFNAIPTAAYFIFPTFHIHVISNLISIHWNNTNILIFGRLFEYELFGDYPIFDIEYPTFLLVFISLIILPWFSTHFFGPDLAGFGVGTEGTSFGDPVAVEGTVPLGDRPLLKMQIQKWMEDPCKPLSNNVYGYYVEKKRNIIYI